MLEVKKRINKLQILISNSWMDFLFVCFVFSLPLRLRSAMLASRTLQELLQHWKL